MVLLCQLFTISAAFSVQYPHGEHPSGIVLAHHHADLSQHAHPYQEAETLADLPVQMPFNATESQAEILAATNAPQSASDHEHSSQSLSAAHPPFESVFVAEFAHASTLSDDDISYQTHQYAPLIPPPHQ